MLCVCKSGVFKVNCCIFFSVFFFKLVVLEIKILGYFKRVFSKLFMFLGKEKLIMYLYVFINVFKLLVIKGVCEKVLKFVLYFCLINMLDSVNFLYFFFNSFKSSFFI